MFGIFVSQKIRNKCIVDLCVSCRYTGVFTTNITIYVKQYSIFGKLKLLIDKETNLLNTSDISVDYI
jgi:hypothetical protein